MGATGRYGDWAAVPPPIDAGLTQAIWTPVVTVCPVFVLMPCPGTEPALEVTMNIRRIKPSGTFLVAVVALVIGLEAPAAAHQIASKVNGSTIKKHSIAGNRLKNNTVTGKQVKESTLGVVPEAKTLPKLVWHKLALQNPWVAYSTLYYDVPSYAVDAQGIVHLQGVLTGGLSATIAFTLPKNARPDAFKWLTVNMNGADEFGALFIDKKGFVEPDFPSPGPVSLDGVEFSTS